MDSDTHSASCFDCVRQLRTKFRTRLGRHDQIEHGNAASNVGARTAGPAHGPVYSNSVVPSNFCCAVDGKDGAWTSEEPPSYDDELAEDIFSPEVIQTIESTIDDLDDELRELSLKIHDHPELGYEEHYAHDTLTAFMSKHDFKVTPHYLGLKTAWRAEVELGNGGRVLGVNSEMDALPGVGHACGHNLIAISGVGIALAAKAALEKHAIPGKVVLLGTPSEEGGGGKIQLLERGGYKDMDLCLMCHPGAGPKNSAGTGPSLATLPITVEYFGHTAHAAAAPWEGQNALDAAVLAYNNVAVLRQQIRPSYRVHGIIEGRNWAPNIIPDYAKMRWIVRAPSYPELEGLQDRVQKCIEAAALATACRVGLTVGIAYYDLRQNQILAKEFERTVLRRYGMTNSFAEGAIGGSTDFGNVSYELPALHPAYSIPTAPNGGNHTPEFTKAARTIEAHKATIIVTKGLAIAGVRALVDRAFYAQVKKSFQDSKPAMLSTEQLRT